MNINRPAHLSVMPKEVIEGLAPKDGGIYVDGTLGLGGHAKKILELIGESGILLGVDRDENSLAQARKFLENFKKQCFFVHSNYQDIDTVLKSCEIDKVDGIILDLGISSFQLDDPNRGFGFKSTGPLDMRLDQSQDQRAWDLVNQSSEEELAKIIKDFGEEHFARRIARNIVKERQKSTIETTEDLKTLIVKSVPKPRIRARIHPATRTFQALRIAVNYELESLSHGIDKCIDSLSLEGRLVIISFHSLEDRIVKLKFKECAKNGQVKILTKKPLRPSLEEVTENSRARSARLRLVQKIL